MKLSQSKLIYDLLEELGISSDPASLSHEELERLSKNPELRQKVVELLSAMQMTPKKKEHFVLLSMPMWGTAFYSSNPIPKNMVL